MIKAREELLRLQEENQKLGAKVYSLSSQIISLEQDKIDLANEIKSLKEGIAKARDKIELYKADCDLSVDEYLSCKDCNENVFKTIFGIIDAITESEGE